MPNPTATLTVSAEPSIGSPWIWIDPPAPDVFQAVSARVPDIWSEISELRQRLELQVAELHRLEGEHQQYKQRDGAIDDIWAALYSLRAENRSHGLMIANLGKSVAAMERLIPLETKALFDILSLQDEAINQLRHENTQRVWPRFKKWLKEIFTSH